jgi:hypothetical protein
MECQDVWLRLNVFSASIQNPSRTRFGTPPTSGLLPGLKCPKTGTPEQAYALRREILARIECGEETIAVPDGFGAWR